MGRGVSPAYDIADRAAYPVAREEREFLLVSVMNKKPSRKVSITFSPAGVYQETAIAL